MKRYGNLFEQIIDINNLLLAHSNARKNKTFYKEVKMVDKIQSIIVKKFKRC